MNQYYLTLKAVSFDSFISDCEDLSTVRGGSLLLLNAADDIRDCLGEHHQVLLTGASKGLFAIAAADDAAAEAVRARVQQRLREGERRDATFVVDVVRQSDDFPRDQATWEAQSRYRQLSQLSVALPGWNDDLACGPCDLDQVRPGTQRGPRRKDRRLTISEAVKRRRESGRTQRQDFYRKHSDSGEGAHPFVEALEDLADLSRWHAPRHPLARSKLDRKIGVLYFDGNDFGRRLRACGDRQALSAFGERVGALRRDLLTQLVAYIRAPEREADWLFQPRAAALEESSDDQDDDRRAPGYRLETLLWGGDETRFVVPAWCAFAFAARVHEAIKSWTFQGDRLTHAFGLVLCRYNGPIHRIARLTEELATLAKRDKGANRMAFTILDAFDSVTPTPEVVHDVPLEGLAGLPTALAALQRVLPARRVLRLAAALRRGQQIDQIDHSETPLAVADAHPLLAKVAGCLGYQEEPGVLPKQFWCQLAELWDYVPALAPSPVVLS